MRPVRRGRWRRVIVSLRIQQRIGHARAVLHQIRLDFDFLNLVRKEHGVKHKLTGIRTDDDDMFAVVHGHFGDRVLAVLLHSLAKERVRLGYVAIGNQVV